MPNTRSNKVEKLYFLQLSTVQSKKKYMSLRSISDHAVQVPLNGTIRSIPQPHGKQMGR